MTGVIRGEDADAADPRLGGKARALAALSASGLPIPPWFVLLPEAFEPGPAASLRPEALAELQAALQALCPQGTPVAVRSSASDEDGPRHSFAGQLDSFLFVPHAEVTAKASAVRSSGFSERIMAYRREHGLPPEPKPPAVLVQRMVVADAAGVAFSADSVSGRRAVAVVGAVWGMGTALVSGEADADAFHVDLAGRVVFRHVARNPTAHRAAAGSPEGVETVPVPQEDVERPSLTDGQAAAIADMARRAARWFGRPQDVEWALEGEAVHLLQSRPITSLAGAPDPDGVRRLWDDSNISESYNGVATPLTFSFARKIYESVYRQFCRLLRVPAAAIARNEEIFPRMLGLVRGRIYYNLVNWHRLLALLPGYVFNRSFMEQMMGVKEGLPPGLVEPPKPAGFFARSSDAFALAGSGAAILWQNLRIERTIRGFRARLEEALGAKRPDLEPLRPDELAAYYRTLEGKLLLQWDAPLVNDFLAMIFFGVLRKLCGKWCGDADGALHNDLLCGEGGMISAEPAVRVGRLAEIARTAPEFAELLREGSQRAIERAMPADFRAEYEANLEKFGDRCLEELKLESPTLFDEPLTLLRAAGRLAERPPGPASRVEDDLRRRAEERVRDALAGRPLRRLIFGWVLRNARGRVRDRENLRFERTRLFGRVRDIFVALGRKLHAVDLLDAPRDVFYLEVEEVFGFLDGTGGTVDLRGLTALRKAEFERFRREPPPAGRFETRGMVFHGNRFEESCWAAPRPSDEWAADPAKPSPDDLQRKGLGCCPGRIQGPARVVLDPRKAEVRRGEVLVAERTDPGWIMLFPAAAGLVVERGSLLSHSAIVARELGLPAVVSLEGATTWLRTGDWIELDGASGVVQRIPAPQASSARPSPDAVSGGTEASK